MTTKPHNRAHAQGMNEGSFIANAKRLYREQEKRCQTMRKTGLIP